MLTVTHITLNYADELSGVDKLPIVGWQYTSDKTGVVQTDRSIQIASDPDFKTVIFDSGWQQRTLCNDNLPEQLALHPSQRYYVRVRLRDSHQQVSEWSRAACFITGVMGNWQGEFISAETPADSANSAGSRLRRAFSVNKKKTVHSAFVHATAMGLYQLWLNGKRVGEDELTPGWTSYRHHLLYQTYDITDLLQPEHNMLGAELGAGWFKGDMGFVRHRNIYGEQTGLLCQLVIHYDDGEQVTIGSDRQWQAGHSPILFSEIYDGERYDATLDDEKWCQWSGSTTAWRDALPVAWNKKAVTAQGAGTVRESERLKPVSVFVTPEGDTVLDFGQIISGWVEFRVQGNAGDKVELRHFEVLDHDGNVYLDNLRTAQQCIEYTLRGGEEEIWRPHFTFQGFRYVKVEQWPGEITAAALSAIVLHSQMAAGGTFSCSHPGLNQLYQNILWGLKGNFIDVPTDCPQRDERLGWTGDAQIFCRTATYMMNVRNFFSKWLVDLACDQTPEGGVPHVIPDIITGKYDDNWLLSQGTHSAAAWADAAVVIPWTLYLMYGDKITLARQYDSMCAWVNFMQTHSDNHIWNYKLQFGDWVALDAEEGSYFGATPNELTCTAWYAYSTLLLAKSAQALGKVADAEKWYSLYDEILTAFRKAFFTPEGNLTAKTQTAHILALTFNLVPDVWRQQTIDTLLSLLDEHDGHLVTGFVGTPLFCHALSENGHPHEAWSLLLKDTFPSWLYQVNAGATTIWEHWDGLKPDGSMWSADMNSFNHYAYGAVGEWIWRVAAGIEADENAPGFEHVIIRPRPDARIQWLKATYPSVLGDISVHWQIASKNEVTLNFSIPAASRATVMLPDANDIIDSGGLMFNRIAECWQAQTGAGEYSIVFQLK
ncbi:alpha-L-rhamnosidase [Citrobacter freundii]|uniref:alpha-L-rhamnosidase n=1 Tax=Citrobacter freundii TaxID=546 RepID=UPI00383BA5F6